MSHMRAQLQDTRTLPPGEWALLMLAMQHGLVVASSSGKLYIFDHQEPQAAPAVVAAHDTSVHSMVKIDDRRLVSCAGDGIKLWDLLESPMAVRTLTSPKKAPFLSLAHSNGLLAGGTELTGQDAEVHIWDLSGTLDSPVRSFVDSHHDDVTFLQFHPSLNYLMSGSTDGCVNIYDLDQPDEEEALHQVINFASVHSCQFVQKRRVAVLSHMETLGFFELNNNDYENPEEPQPNIVGDVRSQWPDCEYVVKLCPLRGFVAFGANSQRKLTLLPFDPVLEQVDVSRPCWLAGAHDEEVVRDVIAVSEDTVLTCGEDGAVRRWVLPWKLRETAEAEETKDKRENKEKREKKKSSEKKEKKQKEKKDRKEEKLKRKHKKDVKFKPY